MKYESGLWANSDGLTPACSRLVEEQLARKNNMEAGIVTVPSTPGYFVFFFLAVFRAAFQLTKCQEQAGLTQTTTITKKGINKNKKKRRQ